MAGLKKIQPGGVDEYIAKSPIDAQDSLRKIRSAIIEAAPGTTETVSYFQIPGYSYEGYAYNGMFVWFSYKSPFVRLHVIPPVIDNHIKQLANYTTTKSVVSFPINKALPIDLIKELVKASIKVMKDKSE
jgi:uncharacterized protein YdhG (YjbR/CyaY superfamily)